jgi:hypothetical protein
MPSARRTRRWLFGSVAACALAALGQAAEPAQENPYLARPGLSRAELTEFLKAMQSKPASLRRRPGFQDAVIDAADRLLQENDQDEPARDAILAKFAAWHALALADDQRADKQLAALVDQWAADRREQVLAAVAFHRLEQQALAADDLQPADLPPLLAALTQHFSAQVPLARDLRLASATVRIINRLPDEQAALAAFRQLGQLWAQSGDAELARYGRKIAAAGETQPSAAD